MKAVVFNGPWDVSAEQVSDPRIEEPKDAIIKITTADICGGAGADCGVEAAGRPLSGRRTP